VSGGGGVFFVFKGKYYYTGTFSLLYLFLKCHVSRTAVSTHTYAPAGAPYTVRMHAPPTRFLPHLISTRLRRARTCETHRHSTHTQTRTYIYSTHIQSITQGPPEPHPGKRRRTIPAHRLRGGVTYPPCVVK